MIERLQAKRNSEEGFTLIELLIVIIVLGILAAIVVFAVSGTKKDAVEATCKTDVKAIELSAESVLAKVSTYDDLADVVAADLDDPARGGLLKEEVPMDKGSYTLNWTSGAVAITSPDGPDAGTDPDPVANCDALGA